MPSDPFSLARALRVLSKTLEVATITGLLVKFALIITRLYAGVDSLDPAIEISFEFVVFCTAVFALLVVYQLILNWRRGLFLLARLILYLIMAGFTVSMLGSAQEGVGSNLPLERTAICSASTFQMTKTLPLQALLALGGGRSAPFR